MWKSCNANCFCCLDFLSLLIISPLHKIRHWTVCFHPLKVVEVKMNYSFTWQSYVYWTRGIVLLLWLLRTFWKRSSVMWQDSLFFYISIQSHFINCIYEGLKLVNNAYHFSLHKTQPAWDGKLRYISYILTIQKSTTCIYKKLN